MKISALIVSASFLLAASAQAQESTGCPRLPADAGLTWEHRGTGNADFCRALNPDGSEAFGVYIASESPFEPNRRNREEVGTVDGRDIHWYRAEVATRPDIKARETLIELDDGRVAHIWMQADSTATMFRLFQVTSGLRFGASRLDTQMAAGE